MRVQWFYSSGATLVMHVVQGVVDGKYRLPQHEEVDGTFPSYRGTASVTYRTYAVNIPIDDPVFSGQAAH